jgi:NAD-dependent deacetylase
MSTTNSEPIIEQAADLIRSSRQLVVLTGAGVSKESGVPTFRDSMDGLWAQFDPEQLATASAFQRDPGLVWRWYEYRRQTIRPAQPNGGHYALARLQQLYPHTRLITQNVDDLHEQAGSTDVIRLHGRITDNRCSANCRGISTLIDVTAEQRAAEMPPPCPYCGALVRPGVVWFGEALPSLALSTAFRAVEQADVMLVVGTSGVVRPASDMPFLAKRAGAKIIEFNPIASAITEIADLWLQGPSGELLPRVLDALERHA